MTCRRASSSVGSDCSMLSVLIAFMRLDIAQAVQLLCDSMRLQPLQSGCPGTFDRYRGTFRASTVFRPPFSAALPHASRRSLESDLDSHPNVLRSTCRLAWKV